MDSTKPKLAYPELAAVEGMQLDPEAISFGEPLDRESFDQQIERLWPQASKLPLAEVAPLNRDAMYAAHVTMKLRPKAIVAGFAHAYKSGAMR